MKQFLVVFAITMFLLSGCAGLNLVPSTQTSIFDEIKNLALQGEPESNGMASYRKNGDYFIAVVSVSEGTAILARHITTNTMVLVGYYPDLKDSVREDLGEYLIAFFHGSELIDRKVVSKEEAEKKAQEFLELFKKGTKSNLTEWMQGTRI